MRALTLGQLTIEVDERPQAHIDLHWKGVCNDRQPQAQLEPFFVAAVHQARGDHKALHVHFERLSYFNSSTVGALLQFIENAGRANVPLDIYYDGTQRWQGHNFEAIAALTKTNGLVKVHKVTPQPAA